MSKKYESLASEVIKLVGGKSNIKSVHHCQTRLRFNLKDDSKALSNEEKINQIPEVLKTINQGGMFQVVVGMDVADAYEEVEKLLGPGFGGGAAEENGAPAKKMTPFELVSDFISSIFSPIVPALAGAGMIKALLALLTAFSLVSKSSQTYILINMFGDATFAFMPMLLAYTTADKLKCNKILAAVTAGIMCHATWTGLVGAGEAVRFAGIIPLYLVKYTSSVIPIILVILVQNPVEKWLNKTIPGSIRLVFAPMIEFIVMGVLALSVIGPIGDYVGMAFTAIFTTLSETVGWLELGLLGGTYSIMVIFGLHHGLAPIGTMQMAQMGYDGVFGPAVVCANIGQGTASLVTGLLSKDAKTRQVGVSAGITGLMGTTEPALYGVNVPKKYPLIAGAIGSLCGSLFAGATHTHRFATGSSGLPAVVMYIGGDTMAYFYQIIISLVITIVVSAIVTVILFKKYEKNASDVITESPVPSAEPASSSVKAETIPMPVAGEVLPVSKASDEAFASEAMGKGAVVLPSEGLVRAPFDGTVMAAFPTGHAIGLVSDQGAELLIHIGIDTVEMNGKGFELLTNQGDPVKKGQALVKFDIAAIEAAGKSAQTIVIVSNTPVYSEVSLDPEAKVIRVK